MAFDLFFFCVAGPAVLFAAVSKAALGDMAGVPAHHMVPERLPYCLTCLLLTLTGSKLIWDGLT